MTFSSLQGSGQTVLRCYLQSWGIHSSTVSDVLHLREVHERLLDQLGQLLWTWRTSGSPLRASQMSEPPLSGYVQPPSGGNSFPPLVLTLSFFPASTPLLLSTPHSIFLPPLDPEMLELLRSTQRPFSVPVGASRCSGGSSQGCKAAHHAEDNKNAHTHSCREGGEGEN